VHLHVAAYLGFKPKEQAGRVNDPAELEQLAGLLGSSR